jgi:D-glycero-alpha-D-manno-heptose 1-phosphate guanylyltransferase
MVDSAIILAGGLGTRLQGAVKNLPKPMAPILGRPFLEWQMDYWINQGIKNFVLSVGFRYTDIQSHFMKSYRSASIEYAIEKAPLGTGGGLLLAFEKLNSRSPFVLLNGDTFFEVDLKKLNDFAVMKNADWCFSLFKSKDNHRYMGLQFDPKTGKLKTLRSEKSNIENYVNGGVYWVNPRSLTKLNAIPGESYSLENNFFSQMDKYRFRNYGFASNSRFIDIGLPLDYQRACEIIGKQ